MAIKYSIDVLAVLKENGYSTYKLRKDRLLSEGTIQLLRNGEPVSWANIDRICRMLECQPGDLLKYESEEE